MTMLEDFRKNINNSLKEIQDNTDKQIEALNRKPKKTPQKSLRDLQENTTKQVKKLNKLI